MRAEPSVNAFLRANLKPGAVFFDCGANVGWLTVLGSRLVGPRGLVVAFEPGSAIDSLADGVREANAFNVHIEHAAVSSVTGYAMFKNEEYNQAGALSTDGDDRVKTWSLDDYVAGTGLVPEVIKFDLEGHEAEAIRGCAGLISAHRPLIVFEQMKDDLSAIGLLQGMGYRVTNLHTYLPVDSAADFPGVVQNLVAWKPGFHKVMDMGRENLPSVAFHREGGLHTASPGPMAAGFYLFEAVLPNDQAPAKFHMTLPDYHLASHSPLYWLSQSYGTMAAVLEDGEAAVITLETEADITLPPLRVFRLTAASS